MSKPVIGVNADYRSPLADKPGLTYLASDYYDAILRAGGLPMVLPPLSEEADVQQALDHLDGVLLIGGADLDPTRDGWVMHPSVSPMDPRREDFDRLLARCVVDRRVPVFGIGAGMQLINLTCGGNLHLHIPEDCPTALPHRDPIDPAHRHTLQLRPGSLMDRVYGDGELRVNSMHHMAIDDLAAGFQVTARCPDGIVEAIESVTKDWFALGTQFHPEANTASALDLRIFEEFVSGVKECRGGMRIAA